MRNISEGIQGEFRQISDEFENGSLKLSLPYSSLERWIKEDDFLLKASASLGIWKRLGGIRSLSFLSYVGPDPESRYSLGYSHHRLDHSLGVSLTSGEIVRLNNSSQTEIKYSEASGLLHDTGMPALGDATKVVDPENLDEEEFWREVLDDKAYHFLKTEGLELEEIGKIIKNKGKLGQVLDIADRIYYTMQDLHNVVGRPESKINIEPYLIEIRYPLSHDLNIGDIYKDVIIDPRKDKVFFADPNRLGIFLLLRALMHKNLYIYPTSQGRDLLIANLIRPLYSADGTKTFSPQNLRQMTDKEALDVLAEKYNFPRLRGDWLYGNLTNWHPRFDRSDSVEEAESRATELRRIGKLVIGVRECRGFDTGASYLVYDRKYDQIDQFREVEPEMTRQLKELEESTRGAFVFYSEPADDSPVNELIKLIA